MKALGLLISAIAALTTLSDAEWTAPYKVSLYHTNWATYGRNYQVKDIPIDYVSDIAYAFFNVMADGSVVTGDSWADFDKRFTDSSQSVAPPDTWMTNDGVYGNFGQFVKLRTLGKKFTFSISVGGWTWSKYFSSAVSTATSRAKFSSDLIALFKKYTFIDGVSVDWEYLSNDGVNYGLDGNQVNKADADNFVTWLKYFRAQLASNGFNDKIISMCSTAAPKKVQWDVPTLAPLLDELHVMTYDFADGNWGDKVATHHTNLYHTDYTPFSVDEAVTYYLAKGFPANKIMIGAAYYSRGFANTNGIGQASSGGSLDMTWETGVADYKTLPRAGAIEYWDPVAQASYSYDATRRVLNSYDTVDSVKAKCNYVKSKGLKGIIVWESSADADSTTSRSLTKAMYDCFHSGSTTPAPAPPAAKPTTKAVVASSTTKAVVASSTTKAGAAPTKAVTTTKAASKPSTTSSAAKAKTTKAAKPSPAVSATLPEATHNSTLPVAPAPPPTIELICNAKNYDYHFCTGGSKGREFAICQRGRGWLRRSCPPSMTCQNSKNSKSISCVMK